ncbi:OB-fold-containig protein [Caulobacter sp. 17J65-9]|uniref:OB-fold-containig protein n=1 Tax=Caulobacter sp. 17J65-9 TaxID=2709382 RepID=UPI0013C978F2|nr:OB-fold-containig protein [Caulobacter sp. 17J65-9]NEX94179.1 YqiJ family protein [Caulobacter sp. 17J65-9]
MFHFLLAGGNVPFLAALVLMLLIGAAELAGLGGGLSGDIDMHADVGEASLLSWLNVGRMPFLMLLVVFLLSFGLIGLIGQRVIYAMTGATAPALLAAPAAFAVALPFTRLFGRGLAKVMPKDETSAVDRDSLVGRVAVIVTGDAKPGSAAQARVRDVHGQPHYVMIEPDVDETLEQGASVLIVRRAGAKFFAIRNLSASLRDAVV